MIIQRRLWSAIHWSSLALNNERQITKQRTIYCTRKLKMNIWNYENANSYVFKADLDWFRVREFLMWSGNLFPKFRRCLTKTGTSIWGSTYWWWNKVLWFFVLKMSEGCGQACIPELSQWDILEQLHEDIYKLKEFYTWCEIWKVASEDHEE